MDGLIHAALEAEVILNRAKHAHSNLSHFDGAVQEHKMIWTHEKINLSESVDDTRMKFHRSVTGSSTKANEKFDLFKKLHELYNDLSRDELSHTSYQGLKTTSYLLEKLLATYNLNTLIINLYPGNKGYSLSLKVNGNTQYLQTSDGNTSASEEETLIETPRWPYEEEELLSYIDNEELPVVLLDLLESEHSNLFYSGCIIAQVRDYRQAYPSSMCDTHHVLLRPTNQSLITDAMCIGTKCGLAGEERSALEAVEAALVFVNRKRKLDQFTHYHGLELLELIHRQRAKNSRQSVPHTRLTSKFPKKPPEPLPLALPSEPSGPLRLARSYERPRPTSDCQPQLVEEYVLETEKTSPHASAGFFHIKLSILQRPSDQEFLGELYVDRDHVEGERNGAACRFSLGSRLQANKYIQQFTEIFTEEGRKSVRIKHIVPGQLPRVSFTGGMRELQAQLQQVGTVGGVATVGTVVGNVGNVGTVVGSVGTVVGNVGTVVGNVGTVVGNVGPNKTAVPKPRSTNPAINALVTSLMNSAQQFQQVASTASSNATILNLLNSAPAAMTHVTSSADTSIEHKLLTRAVSIAGARLIAATTAPHTIPTYTQQGVSLASLQTLQGLQSIPGLAGLQGVQNVQVQIPGLAAPISLSLNVSGAPSGLLVSVPPTTSVVLANQPSVLSLPIGELHLFKQRMS
ncbi:unnamed protein product [Leptidea sinapis]|uniref:Spt20-like SEP domain-containing protein n=1 Tax=Leptidea sinapis TaxID=189913 RepID=A0A5E4R8E0_9NEOP|nr:unnamed protein product [Leptidea sinapis]